MDLAALLIFAAPSIFTIGYDGMSNPHDTAENQRSLFKPYVFQPKLLDSKHQSRFSTPAVAVQRREQDEVRLKQK